MRIGIDCYSMQHSASGGSGIGRYSRELTAEMLKAAPDDEFVLYVVDGMTTDCLPAGPNARWVTIPAAEWGNRSLSVSLAFHLLNTNPEQLDSMLFTSMIQSNSFRRPPIERVAGILYDTIPWTFASRYFQDHQYHDACESGVNALRDYDAIFTMSEHARGDLVESFEFEFDKIHVLGTGANPMFRPASSEREKQEDTAIRHRLGIFGRYIFNTGNADPRKGSAHLVRAFCALPEEVRAGVQIVFSYLAPPSHRNELTTIANRSGVIDSIGDPALLAEIGTPPPLVFTDWQPTRVLAALYRGAEAMAFPSAYEGFGLPLLEAMACGCPVIGGDNSSQPEVIDAAGMVVDPTDTAAFTKKLDYVLSNESARRSMSDLGLHRAMKFRWPDTARRALKILREIPNPASV
jgi:glycosyltransferase involved in cell wall biosynthesis